MEARFCTEALQEALERFGKPDIFNTDQGCQFTSAEFTGILESHGIAISMNGKNRTLDNIFVERFWRTFKYDDVYLKGYVTVPECRAGLTQFFDRLILTDNVWSNALSCRISNEEVSNNRRERTSLEGYYPYLLYLKMAYSKIYNFIIQANL